MSTLPTSSATNFCKAFIERQLEEFKTEQIWMSSWDTMSRLIERSEEMTDAYEELIARFGFSDVRDPFANQESKEAIWLILEHIWSGHDYSLESVNQAKAELKALRQIDHKVSELSQELSAALQEQEILYEQSGFSRANYQSIPALLELAGSNNPRYSGYVSKAIKPLSGQFDLRYWPDRSEMVSAIAEFEQSLDSPTHYIFTDEVLNGRESVAKDFVISFDKSFEMGNQLPDDFRFSNKAMAAILNVVLNIDAEHLCDDTNVRIIRHRYNL
ncbi:hypothetical protein [Bacterioplanoides sp.]|uniref:hypothetical protein n=1 Tax=Bacterioplanoides sp. TaxID=2066072 RepID=UPI003B59516E